MRMRRILAVIAAAAMAGTFAAAVQVGNQKPASALENGLAQTPPMGFNDWNAFHCNVNAQLIEQTADAMASNGMKAAGYQYVNIDDCWLAQSRDANGNLVPDPAKFPQGIQAVADYVHSKGLKLGIYEDAGTQTCAKYPGSYGHEAQDAKTFASWGVDYLKYDWCNVPFQDFPGQTHQQVAQTLYTRMRDALAASGRQIVFSMCNGWDAAVQPQTWAQPVANLWRTTHDIQDNYASMLDIFHSNINYSADAKPGAWNDPDMLEIGNGGMTTTEYQSHFSLWAEMAAPLIAGTDLRTASPTTLSILTNRDVIAVDQDPMGKPGYAVAVSSGNWVLTRQLAGGDRAVVLFNENAAASTISTTAQSVGMHPSKQYTLTDLWAHQSSTTTSAISATVPAHGVVMYRVHAGS
jgi:alpha-galactosidase